MVESSRVGLVTAPLGKSGQVVSGHVESVLSWRALLGRDEPSHDESSQVHRQGPRVSGALGLYGLDVLVLRASVKRRDFRFDQRC